MKSSEIGKIQQVKNQFENNMAKMYHQNYVDCLNAKIKKLTEEEFSKNFKWSDSSRMVRIPFHPEKDDEIFSEALECLSHALEGVDMISNEMPEWEILKEKIHASFLFAEMLERLIFKKD